MSAHCCAHGHHDNESENRQRDTRYHRSPPSGGIGVAAGRRGVRETTIEEVHAELFPEDKVRAAEHLCSPALTQSSGRGRGRLDGLRPVEKG